MFSSQEKRGRSRLVSRGVVWLGLIFVLASTSSGAQQGAGSLAPDWQWSISAKTQPWKRRPNRVLRLQYKTSTVQAAATNPITADLTGHAEPQTSFSPSCNSPQLTYFGGPVVSNSQVVAVYWNTNVNATTQANIPAFLQGATNSSWYDMLSEWSTNVTPSGGQGGTNQSIGRGSYVGAYTLTPAVCSATVTGNCNLTDDQLQAELTADIANQTLPAQQYDLYGNATTVYMVYFPPNITLTAEGSTSCYDFCAYHNTGGTVANPLLYAAVMDTYTGNCSSGCGANGVAGVEYTSSHELAETVTDAAVGLVTGNVYEYPAAWADNNNGCGEIADICYLTGPKMVPSATGDIPVSPLWSNALNGCVLSGVHPGLSVTAPATAARGVPFNFTVTATNPTGGLGTDTSFAGTIHFTSSDTGATLPADFTFLTSDHGTQTFSATLASVAAGSTITATETLDSAIVGQASVAVNQAYTVGTSPAGLAFTVDGTPYTSTQVLGWASGSNHTIATTSPQSVSEGTATFANWSDSGAISHTVTAGATTNYTATFTEVLTPTIVFTPPVKKRDFDGPFTVSASSDSGGAFTYKWVSGPATVSSAGMVTLTGAPGTVVVEADEAASGSYVASSKTANILVTKGSVWALNTSGSASELDLTGAAFSLNSGYTGAGVGTPVGPLGIAFDASGSAWIASSAGVSKFDGDGNAVSGSPFTGGGAVVSPGAVAVDGNGQVIVANGNGRLTVLSNAGALVSTTTDPSMSGPTGVAIDSAGSVWIANGTTSTVDEVIGGAAPAAPLASGTPGVQP